MYDSMKNFCISVVFLLLLSNDMIAQTPAATIPEFSFLKVNNSVFTNKNLETGKMIFFVFFDSDCDHCHHALQYINLHYSEFSKATIYLVTLDKPNIANGIISKYAPKLNNNKNVTILQDNRNEFIQKFKPRKYPSIFLYSNQKKLLLYDDNEQNLYKFSKLIK